MGSDHRAPAMLGWTRSWDRKPRAPLSIQQLICPRLQGFAGTASAFRFGRLATRYDSCSLGAPKRRDKATGDHQYSAQQDRQFGRRLKDHAVNDLPDDEERCDI
jgi:hypothetical protein